MPCVGLSSSKRESGDGELWPTLFIACAHGLLNSYQFIINPSLSSQSTIHDLEVFSIALETSSSFDADITMTTGYVFLKICQREFDEHRR